MDIVVEALLQGLFRYRKRHKEWKLKEA